GSSASPARPDTKRPRSRTGLRGQRGGRRRSPTYMSVLIVGRSMSANNEELRGRLAELRACAERLDALLAGDSHLPVLPLARTTILVDRVADQLRILLEALGGKGNVPAGSREAAGPEA